MRGAWLWGGAIAAVVVAAAVAYWAGGRPGGETESRVAAAERQEAGHGAFAGPGGTGRGGTDAGGPAWPDPSAEIDPERQGSADDPASRAVQLLAAFHRETDPHALMELAATLRSEPWACGNPEIVRTMLDVARESEDPARWEAARYFLLGCRDMTGEVAQAVVQWIEEGEVDWGEVPGFVEANPTAAGLVHAALLERAERSDMEPHERAQVIAGICPAYAQPAEWERVLAYTASDEPEVRAAVYEAMGRMAPQEVDVAWLEAAWLREAHVGVRQAIILALARARATEALERLGDSEARLWAAVVREYPLHPIEFLREEVERRRGAGP